MEQHSPGDTAAPRTLTRRDVIRTGASASLGLTAALAAGTAPAALATLARDAFAQSSSDAVTDALNFALTLEHLENDFYMRGLAASGLLSGIERATFQHIQQHEEAHVTLLTQTIAGLGGAPVAKPRFDFTAGGKYPDVFTSALVFRTLAQLFEDTGVRAYKGQAAELAENGDVLTTALRIHSVEARHASQVRRLRGDKPYVVGSVSPVPSEPTISAVYAGEDNQTHQTEAGVVTLTTPTPDVAQRAFDEPLSRAAVTEIVAPFLGR